MQNCEIASEKCSGRKTETDESCVLKQFLQTCLCLNLAQRLLVHAAGAALTVTWCHFNFSRCDLRKTKTKAKKQVAHNCSCTTTAPQLKQVMPVANLPVQHKRESLTTANTNGWKLQNVIRDSEVEQQHIASPLLRNPQIANPKYFSSIRIPLTCPNHTIELVLRFPCRVAQFPQCCNS